MSNPQHDIALMIDRLKRAGIPLDNLCYELDELAWQKFIRYLEGFYGYSGRDLSYITNCSYMGMRIRTRGDSPQEAPK